MLSQLSQAEAYQAELKSMQVVLPTMTFDHSLILHRKSRTVEIFWLGNAHTNGDVFVYLPREKVISIVEAKCSGVCPPSPHTCYAWPACSSSRPFPLQPPKTSSTIANGETDPGVHKLARETLDEFSVLSDGEKFLGFFAGAQQDQAIPEVDPTDLKRFMKTIA